MRHRALLLAALTLAPALLAPPLAAESGGWGVELLETTADDGPPVAFTLHLEAGAGAPAATLPVTLFVNHTSPAGAADAWSEPAFAWAVAPGARVAARLEASRGPGSYLVDVRIPGATSPEGVLLVAPDGGAGAATLETEVPDAPTALAYTPDSVNGAGKAKAPGDALVTRIRVADDNGLDDVAALDFAYFRTTPSGPVPVAATRMEDLDGGDATLTTRVVEHRFAASPLPDGDYVEVVTARSRAGGAATIERGFRITNAKSALLGTTPLEPAVAPPEATTRGAFLVGDRNFGTGPLDPSSVPGIGLLTTKLYRGSSHVTDPAWTIALSDVGGGRLDLEGVGHRDLGDAYRVVDGYGAVDLPVAIGVPPTAVAGDYRLSLYHAPNATATPALLGSLAFTVRALPRVASLAVSPGVAAPGATVRATYALADAAGTDRVEVALLRARDGDWVRVGDPVAGPAGNATVTLDVPEDLPAGAYLVEAAPALAPDAPPLGLPSARRTTLLLEAGPPTLTLAGEDGGTRLAAGPLGGPVRLAVAAANFSLEDAPLAWRLVDASGATLPADARVARDAAGALVLDPAGLGPGRYRLRAEAAGVGAAAEARLDVGAWVAVRTRADAAALATAPDGSFTATVPIEAVGNAPAHRLVVSLDGPLRGKGTVTLLDASGAARARAPISGGVARLVAPDLLGPGETGVALRVDLERPSGLDAGRLALALRVHVAPGKGVA